MRIRTYRKIVNGIKVVSILLTICIIVFGLFVEFSVSNLIIFLSLIILLLILGMIRYKMIMKIHDGSDSWYEILNKMESKGIRNI